MPTETLRVEEREMSAEHNFSSDGAGFNFEGDERVDPDLFGLSIQTANFLDHTLVGRKLDEREKSASSKKVLIYLGSRMHGASVAATTGCSGIAARDRVRS